MKRNPWLENLFRPLAIGIMCGCIAQSLVSLVRLFIPTWNGSYLVIGCVLAALEANYSHRLLKIGALRGNSVLRFRVIELLMLFILLKLGGYIGKGWAYVAAEIQTWSHRPISVLNLETLVAFVLTLLSWGASTLTVRDLERIDDPPELHRYYDPPRDTIARRFFFGGAALLILAGLSRIGIAALLNLSRPPLPGLVLNVLIYFLLGLVMMGQVQFATLRRQWQAQSIKVTDELAGRWVRYSLILIGLAALLAFLLPTGYTVGLLDVAGRVLGVVLSILWFIANVILFLLSIPLWLLMYLLSLLAGREPPPQRNLRLPEISRSRPAEPAGVAPGWFEILRSLFFWAVLLGMLIYVIRTYLRDHPELSKSLAGLWPIRMLGRMWAALWHRLSGLSGAIKERLPQLSSLFTRRKPGEAPFRFFRLGALSPRERIHYYYLSILRRAKEQGFPRQRAQTPYEYDETLSPQLPHAQEEMGLLTQSFVEARYSPHPIDQKKEKQTRADWQRVKAALRALKPKGEEAEQP